MKRDAAGYPVIEVGHRLIYGEGLGRGPFLVREVVSKDAQGGPKLSAFRSAYAPPGSLWGPPGLTWWSMPEALRGSQSWRVIPESVRLDGETKLSKVWDLSTPISSLETVS